MTNLPARSSVRSFSRLKTVGHSRRLVLYGNKDKDRLTQRTATGCCLSCRAKGIEREKVRLTRQLAMSDSFLLSLSLYSLNSIVDCESGEFGRRTVFVFATGRKRKALTARVSRVQISNAARRVKLKNWRVHADKLTMKTNDFFTFHSLAPCCRASCSSSPCSLS